MRGSLKRPPSLSSPSRVKVGVIVVARGGEANMLDRLADEELQIIAASLTCSWQSTCDFACVSRRSAISLLASEHVWHDAAKSYLGGQAAAKKTVAALYERQRQLLEKVLTMPGETEQRSVPHLTFLYHEGTDYEPATADQAALQRACPLLSHIHYPAMGGDVGVCLPKNHCLRGALALADRLLQHVDESPLGSAISLASLIGSTLEPMVLALHRTLHRVCQTGFRADEMDTPIPLLHDAMAAWASVRRLQVVEPYHTNDFFWRCDNEKLGQRDRARLAKRRQRAEEWLRSQSLCELQAVLSGTIASFEALLHTATKDEADALADDGNVPSIVWRSLVTKNSAAQWARKATGERDLHPEAQSSLAEVALREAGCLAHLTPRSLLVAVKLALGTILKESFTGKNQQSEYWRSDEREPFPVHRRCQQHDAAVLGKITKIFRDGDGRRRVAELVSLLPHEQDRDWWCGWCGLDPTGSVITDGGFIVADPENLEDDYALGIDELLVHWIAHYVLAPPGRGTEERRSRGRDGQWHPAWEPGVLTPDQHAILLATQMHWAGGWTTVDGLGMLLGVESAWAPADAAVVLHKALRYAGFNEYLPNHIWSIWKRIASEKTHDGEAYALTAETAWALADRWLGARARCAALFNAALVTTGRQKAILGEEGEAQESDDSQHDSDDSCAIAEAGWTEWSWNLA